MNIFHIKDVADCKKNPGRRFVLRYSLTFSLQFSGNGLFKVGWLRFAHIRELSYTEKRA